MGGEVSGDASAGCHTLFGIMTIQSKNGPRSNYYGFKTKVTLVKWSRWDRPGFVSQYPLGSLCERYGGRGRVGG